MVTGITSLQTLSEEAQEKMEGTLERCQPSFMKRRKEEEE